MAVTPLQGPDARETASTQARVWVLDDPRAGTAAQAIDIAERLGVPFRRIPLAWNWMAHIAGLSRHGSLLGVAGLEALSSHSGPGTGQASRPALVISAGSRSAAVALWLKSHHGCRIVHCMRPSLLNMGRLGGAVPGAGLVPSRFGALTGGGDRFDMLVIPEHDLPAAAPNVVTVLGAPHRLSPLVLRQAAAAWEERLAHLPHPRIALLVGGPVRGRDMQPARAHALGRRVARLASRMGGCVLATTSRRTGTEATDALAAGLQRALHVLYRWGEPGDNPYHGMLATADAVIVTADSVSMISEACATSAPVYVALLEQGGSRHRQLIATLRSAGQVRLLDRTLAAWPRQPLDESGRVAAAILERYGLH